MHSIENSLLRVSVANRGAELQSLYHKEFQLEYLWSGNPVYWARKSPVLFPIVGTLKQDSYFFGGKAYRLGRHGFARDMDFQMVGQDTQSIEFLLQQNPETLLHYPFSFEFRIRYELRENDLKVRYTVQNNSEGPIFFSVGGHPAFAVPLEKGLTYEDYYLEFNEDETKPRWPISKDGLMEKNPLPFLKNNNLVPLSKELFLVDALVLKYPTSSILSLKSDKSNHGLDLNFTGFPFLGIWAAPHADFVCLEPWCGIADSVDSDSQLVHKEGIHQLNPGKSFIRTWILTLF
jgi:galactose mutarotase-like enzyme